MTIEKCRKAIENGDLIKALELAKQSVETYPDNFESYLCLAAVYYDMKNFKKALENLKKAEKLTSDKENLINIYYYIAEIYVDTNELDNALTYFHKTLDLIKHTNKDTAYILSRIADTYFRKGNLKKSIEYYSKALKAGEEENASIEFIAGVINNQSVILTKLGYYNKAIKLLENLLAIGSSSNNLTIVCLSEINLGSAYFMAGNKNMAKKYLTSGLNHAKELEDKGLQAIAYMYLGKILKNKDYLNKAEEIFKEINNAYSQLN
jgi:tetratricopeptide (TPR) repeat protein